MDTVTMLIAGGGIGIALGIRETFLRRKQEAELARMRAGFFMIHAESCKRIVSAWMEMSGDEFKLEKSVAIPKILAALKKHGIQAMGVGDSADAIMKEFNV